MSSKNCGCPYCNGSLPDDLCEACDVDVAICPACGKPLPGKAETCAECGEELTKDKED